MGLASLLVLGLVECMTPEMAGSVPTPVRLIPPEAWQPVQSPYGPRVASLAPSVPPATTPKPTRRPAPSVADAKAYALNRLGPTQYACLADIVKHEDGTWDPYRTNPYSGAYGIPQALPGSKMASAGADWRWNRITQVRWMISYVNARYGSACQAAAFRTDRGWY